MIVLVIGFFLVRARHRRSRVGGRGGGRCAKQEGAQSKHQARSPPHTSQRNHTSKGGGRGWWWRRRPQEVKGKGRGGGTAVWSGCWSQRELRSEREKSERAKGGCRASRDARATPTARLRERRTRRGHAHTHAFPAHAPSTSTHSRANPITSIATIIALQRARARIVSERGKALCRSKSWRGASQTQRARAPTSAPEPQ